jgi:hypothetical protein
VLGQLINLSTYHRKYCILYIVQTQTIISVYITLKMGQSAMLEANKRIKKFLQDPTKME